MVNYDDYADEAPGEALVIELGGCRFYCELLRRKDGGYDLALNREHSDFEGLDIPKITWLRHEAGGTDHVFVERFQDQTITKGTKKRVSERFLKWLQSALGLPPRGKIKVRWSGEEGFW